MSDTNFNEVLAVALGLMYNLSLVVGTTYLVVVHEWSMWTYLLCMCFLASIKTGKAAEKNE